ncbi:TPA: dTDP-glucose pyrophosphorylase [Vibrio cholerae]|uniref:dTDP-glucose pyrophosphorylase n=1 Tax=Vibrio cholerae TaxID=666 RepID=UPI0020826033|nr:dTDP-glucose pyrophosphorylase [Vibrio cholerae]
MATGLNEKTGQQITGIDELKQRLNRCFKTRRGSLPLNRAFGSNLPERIDRNITPELQINIFADVADAIAHPPNEFNDEIKLVQAWLEFGENQVTLSLDVQLLFDGSIETISGLSL